MPVLLLPHRAAALDPLSPEPKTKTARQTAPQTKTKTKGKLDGKQEKNHEDKQTEDVTGRGFDKCWGTDWSYFP